MELAPLTAPTTMPAAKRAVAVPPVTAEPTTETGTKVEEVETKSEKEENV